MVPFSTKPQEPPQDTPENEQDDSITFAEAMHGDIAIISTINELNDLRNAEK